MEALYRQRGIVCSIKLYFPKMLTQHVVSLWSSYVRLILRLWQKYLNFEHNGFCWL